MVKHRNNEEAKKKIMKSNSLSECFNLCSQKIFLSRHIFIKMVILWKLDLEEHERICYFLFLYTFTCNLTQSVSHA